MYVGNGGTATAAELQRFLGGTSWSSALQYDIVVSALNHAFTDMDLTHSVPYSLTPRVS